MAKQLINLSAQQIEDALDKSNDTKSTAQEIDDSVNKAAETPSAEAIEEAVQKATKVVANGSETATTELLTIKVDTTVYSIPAGALPSQASQSDALVYNGVTWSKQSGYAWEETVTNAKNATVSIDWDGDTTGREEAGLADLGITAYKVDTRTPLSASLMGGSMSAAGQATGTWTIKSAEEATESDAYTCSLADFIASLGLLVKSGDTTKVYCVNASLVGSVSAFMFVASAAETIIVYEDGYPEDEYQFVFPSAGIFFGNTEGMVYVSNLTYSDGPVTIVHKFDSKYIPADQNKVDKVQGKSLSTNDFTDNDKNKLDGIHKNASKVWMNKTPEGAVFGGVATSISVASGGNTPIKYSLLQSEAATYGSTSFSTITTWLSNNTPVQCVEDSVRHFVCEATNSYVLFSANTCDGFESTSNHYVSYIKVTSGNQWSKYKVKLTCTPV